MPVFLSEKELKSEEKDLEKYRGKLFREEYLPKVKGFPQVRELFQRLLDDGWKLWTGLLREGKRSRELQKDRRHRRPAGRGNIV